MPITRKIEQLKRLVAMNSTGCLADTSFLYAAADTDDRIHEKAIEVFILLEELDIPIYVNVIGRLEFVDLVFRKQMTIGAIETFEQMDKETSHRALLNFLKSIRDENTAQARSRQSYKVSETKLKKLREHFESVSSSAWSEFCKHCAGEKLSNEWQILEEELGLRFVEVMEGETSDIIEYPLRWADMVQVMGHKGLRGSDAMITNLFLKSRLPLLITADSDIVKSVGNSDLESAQKAILFLE